MHPGWAQTNGLDGLFELHPSYKSWFSSFRSAADGADTINWLLTQHNVESGKFWFDREVAREHQWLAGTHSLEGEQDALWEFAEAATEARCNCPKSDHDMESTENCQD